MRIAIAGGTGMLGRALKGSLHSSGHEVVTLRRDEPEHPGDRRWDPEAGRIYGPGLSDVDAVINLAGESIAQRWTAEARERIRSSRMMSTLTVVAALEPDGRCQLLLSGSSCAIYGDRGDEVVGVGAAAATGGFLAKTCVAWEASANNSPVPTVLLRSGHVLTGAGGYVGVHQLASRAGRCGRGGGRQYVPWIHVDDWVAAVSHLATSPIEGPVNLTAPDVVRQADFARARSRVLGRPAALAWPRLALIARFGKQMVEEVFCPSIRAVPGDLLEDGFRFRFPTVDLALGDLLVR